MIEGLKIRNYRGFRELEIPRLSRVNIVAGGNNAGKTSPLERLRARLEELGSRRIELDDGTWYWDLKPDLRPGEVVTL